MQHARKKIVCLWLPNWPVQRLIGARPELRERALLLHAPGRGRGSYVVACCPVARERGVCEGMPLAEARMLVDQGVGRPGPYCQTYNPAADREALMELAAWCERFSPLVGLEESPRPESLLLDITGVTSLGGGQQAFAVRLAEAFGRRGLTIRGAVAGTIGAAWALAHFALPRKGVRNLLYGASFAALPADMPRTFLACKDPDQGFAALRSLPVAALRLGRETVEVLGRLGIEQIDQLVSLPRAALATRFGPELLVRIDQAAGVAAEVIGACRPQPEFAAEWSLEYATGRYDVIDRVVGTLVERVVAKLVAQGRGALQLVCRLTCRLEQPPAWRNGNRNERPETCTYDTSSSPPETLTLTTGLFQPSVSVEHLISLVRMQLARVQIGGPVSRVSVTVTATAALVDRQKRLFNDGRSAQDARELVALVDRLVGRLGRQAVVGVRMVSDVAPERAFCAEPLVASGGQQRVLTAGNLWHETSFEPFRKRVPDTFSPQRPLHVFSRPQPVAVVSVVPAGSPVQLPLAGRRHEVARHWGPERIETGWWRKDSVHRDYYRIETTMGYRFWLFRRLEDGKWFLHGVFA